MCDAYCASCVCCKALGHEGAHVCKCEGSWEGSEGSPEGVTAYIALPTVYIGPERPVASSD